MESVSIRGSWTKNVSYNCFSCYSENVSSNLPYYKSFFCIGAGKPIGITNTGTQHVNANSGTVVVTMVTANQHELIMWVGITNTGTQHINANSGTVVITMVTANQHELIMWVCLDSKKKLSNLETEEEGDVRSNLL